MNALAALAVVLLVVALAWATWGVLTNAIVLAMNWRHMTVPASHAFIRRVLVNLAAAAVLTTALVLANGLALWVLL